MAAGLQLLQLLLVQALPVHCVPALSVRPLYDAADSVALTHGDPALVSMVKHAITEVGLFYVQGVPLREGPVDELVAESRQFFSRPLEEKNRLGRRAAP